MRVLVRSLWNWPAHAVVLAKGVEGPTAEDVLLQAVIVDEWVGRARAIAVAHQVEPLDDIERRIARYVEDLRGQAAAAHERSLPKIVGARLKAILRAEKNSRARLVLQQISDLLE